MKNLIIIGAGGCGREVLQWAKDINNIAPAWDIKGFLDCKASALDGKECGYGVIGREDGYDIQQGDEFICAIGDSRLRQGVVAKLRARGARMATIIHPKAVVADTACIGEGAVIYPFALVSDHTEVGEGAIVNSHTSIGHDARLGCFCTISAHCDITGACMLGQGVFMGSSSQLVPGSVVGDGAYICAGSTVIGRVRPGAKVMGSPARRVYF